MGKYVLVEKIKRLDNEIKKMEKRLEISLSDKYRKKYLDIDLPLKSLISLYGSVIENTEDDVGTMPYYDVLLPCHRIIMDWELDVDEDATIPEILEAAKEKQTKLLVALE